MAEQPKQSSEAAKPQTEAPKAETNSQDKPAEKKDEAPAKKKRKNWLPLESNPVLMTKYIAGLGVSSMFGFNEVMGVDPDLLAVVPQPVYAVLLCFPVSQASEKHREEEEARIAKDGQPDSKNVYHMLQTVGNACGTIGLVHAVLNNRDMLDLDKHKFFAKFYSETKSMSASERAAALEANTDIEVTHQAVANDSEAKSRLDNASNVNLHFIAFVCVDGHMWELDGRKKRPICHGKSSLQTLLYDAVGAISQFMSRDSKELRFNMAALTPMFAFDD